MHIEKHVVVRADRDFKSVRWPPCLLLPVLSFTRLEDIAHTLPDPSLPLEQQLTRALQTIKEQMKTIKDLQAQVKVGFQHLSSA